METKPYLPCWLYVNNQDGTVPMFWTDLGEKMLLAQRLQYIIVGFTWLKKEVFQRYFSIWIYDILSHTDQKCDIVNPYTDEKQKVETFLWWLAEKFHMEESFDIVAIDCGDNTLEYIFFWIDEDTKMRSVRFNSSEFGGDV